MCWVPAEMARAGLARIRPLPDAQDTLTAGSRGGMRAGASRWACFRAEGKGGTNRRPVPSGALWTHQERDALSPLAEIDASKLHD